MFMYKQKNVFKHFRSEWALSVFRGRRFHCSIHFLFNDKRQKSSLHCKAQQNGRVLRHCRSGTEKITHWGEVVRKNVLCLDIMRWYPIVFTHFSAIRIKFAFIYIIKTFSTFLFIVLIVRFSWQNDKEQWQNCLHINLRLFIEGWNTCVK